MIDKTKLADDLTRMSVDMERDAMRALLDAAIETHPWFEGVTPGGDLHSYLVGMLAFASRLPDRVLKPGQRILDVGSGHARLLIALQKAFGIEGYGVDKYAYAGLDAPNVLTDATRTLWALHDRLNLRILSPFDIEKESLPYPDGFFDAVTSQQAVEHFHDTPKPVFDDVLRVLKPGGAFLIDTPNHAAIHYHFAMLRGRTVHWDLEGYYNHHFSRGVRGTYLGHWREFTVDELAQMLRWAGFDIELAETAMYAPGLDDTTVLQHYLAEIAAILREEYGAELSIPARADLVGKAAKVRRLRDTSIVTARKPGGEPEPEALAAPAASARRRLLPRGILPF